MKKFIISILCVSVFFIGLGGLIDKVGAKFKSDDKALELLSLARTAVGGEASIKAVQSMSIVGKATKTFDFDGASRSEEGDWELNLQLPNKFSKMMKVRVGEGGTGEKIESAEKNVVIIKRGEGDKVLMKQTEELPKEGVVIVKKGDGDNKVFERTEIPNGDVRKVIVDDNLRTSLDKMEHNDLFRTTLALLLTAPQDINAEYTFAGEGSVDGISCNIIEARVGDSSVKLYLDKSTNLPQMMSYQDAKPMMFFRINKTDGDAENDTKTFTRKVDAPEMAEYQVKFSDYRSVNGLQLPFHWTQTVGGKQDESIEISSYEINPANIAEKFSNQPQKIMMRMKKEQ
ncbi:MAG TPA: hypothetical protein VGC76_16220 [Pyrinomonadaceae bacterium]